MSRRFDTGFGALFGEGRVFIGVVHLPALPGSPRWAGNMELVLDRAEEDALALRSGGADGIIVENFGDAPFRIGRVDPETVAGVTLAVNRIRQVTTLPLGINMLRNDARSALAVAAATQAQFIRVNVHYGVMAADEGLVEGEAFATLRQRRLLGSEVLILADVMVKHAVPLGPVDLGLVARETISRGLADGLIISGPATGLPAVTEDVATVRRALPGGLLLVGSGVNPNNAQALLAQSDGAIVGTWLKQNGVIINPVDPERVKQMGAAIKKVTELD